MSYSTMPPLIRPLRELYSRLGYCPEIPGANGQGRNREECLHSLASAMELILEDRREEGLRGVPKDAVRDVVKIG